MSEPLVLLRHFPSLWNDPQARRFTGWVDIGLARGSYEQGLKVGAILAEQGYVFDECYTSQLQRAVRSGQAVLKGMGSEISITKDTRLNERRYGDLEGMTHERAREKYGDEQVRQWRRSFSAKPPGGDSLEDTLSGVIGCWFYNLEPLLRTGKRVLVVAHGNSLRALIMYLTGMNAEQVETLEIPTGVPILCEVSENPNGLYVSKHRYLSV